MKDKGMAHIGIGNAKGDDKAIEAVKLAVASPLLETTINGATHVIINISGDISLMDANDAASYVQDLAGDNANIIFGAKYDESMTDEATITVIATGLENPGATSKIMPKLNYATQTPTRPVSGSTLGSNHRNRCSDLSAAGRTWYSNTASAGYPETASAGEHGAADGHQNSGFPEEFTQIELQ